jgi:hypothetical protein
MQFKGFWSYIRWIKKIQKSLEQVVRPVASRLSQLPLVEITAPGLTRPISDMRFVNRQNH